ncbi:MAG: hypothetical protein PHD15_01740 [Clostridia bacterium]|nr:hypothetical protein [Clostridia bacterium]MDD4386473.1 hypothetical protein [Clostridia bacterium]
MKVFKALELSNSGTNNFIHLFYNYKKLQIWIIHGIICPSLNLIILYHKEMLINIIKEN